MADGLSTRSFIPADQFRSIVPVFGRLSLAAVVGPLIFTGAWIVLGYLRPGFNSVSDPVSGLGVGNRALLMNASFVVCGIATVVGVLGLSGVLAAIEGRWRWTETLLLGLSGVGVCVDGLFTYKAFMPHFLGFMVAIGLPMVGFPLVGRRLRALRPNSGLGSWLFIAGPLLLVLAVIFFRTFDPYRASGLGIAGLTERLLILTLHATFIALGWYAYKTATHL